MLIIITIVNDRINNVGLLPQANKTVIIEFKLNKQWIFCDPYGFMKKFLLVQSRIFFIIKTRFIFSSDKYSYVL